MFVKNPDYFLTIVKERSISKAAERLKSTRASIGAISAACGYPNQLHFSRAFKKRYGVSPREWRMQNKGQPER